MEFLALILTLFLYYVRPQEWMPEIQPLLPVTLTMALAVLGVIGKTRLSLKDIFRTPHDWLMFAYCFWMVYTSPDRGWAFDQVYPLFLFYLVVVHSLTSARKLTVFLVVWTAMIFVIAALADIAPLGFDPTGSEYRTGQFQGRRALGTSIFGNPNALGHSVVPCVMMIYFIFIWRRPIFTRIGGLPLFFVPLYCVYLTMSKGAFISGFAGVVAALAFGRPKYMQVAILAFALTSGWAAVQTLPRMHEIKDSKNDEAIQGRVAAFEYGLSAYKAGYKGLGFKTFITNMTRDTGLTKASHSSFVQVGAELGKAGFWMFLGIIYCCLRTLVTAKTRDDSEERARRVLFTFLISYLISSWMVDFAYHAAFFFCAGAVAAFHRLMLPPVASAEESAQGERELVPIPAMQISGLDPAPAGASPGTFNQFSQTAIPVGSTPETTAAEERDAANGENPEAAKGILQGIRWNRLGLIDIGLIFVMQYAALRIWVFAIKEM